MQHTKVVESRSRKTMIAIIAGTGQLPVQAAEQLMRDNRPFFILLLFEESRKLFPPTIPDSYFVSQRFYKISAIKALLKQKQTTDLLFIGKVDKRHLLSKISYDWEFIKLSAQILSKGDTAIMEYLVDHVEGLNIRVLKQSDILPRLFCSPGILTGSITPKQQEDINIGLKLATQISVHDIGQTVVIKDTMVLAIEAIEGTDECIRRGITLGKDNIVVCKSARIDQNQKFDIPTLGPQTLKTIKNGEVAVIAWHATRALIVDKDQFISEAEKRGITLIAV